MDALPEPKGGRYFVVDFEQLRAAQLHRIDVIAAALDEPLPALAAESTRRQREVRANREAEREVARETLAKSRAGVVARPKRDAIHFRFPTPAKIEAIGEFRLSRGESRRAQLEVGAVAVGCCWHHRILALESEWDIDDLAAYSEAVQVELQDRGYSEAEIVDLCDAVLTAVANRKKDHAEAESLVGFSGAPRVVPHD